MTDSNLTHNIQVKTFRNRHIHEVPILLRAIQFFLDELLKRCIIKHKIDVTVALRNGPVKASDASINDGLAWEHESRNGERCFHIHLNDNVPFLDLLSTIAHELVHVVQFATGRLTTDDDNWYWDGKPYGAHPYTGDEIIDNQLPWEYDAYSKEIDLARKFVKQYYSVW